MNRKFINMKGHNGNFWTIDARGNEMTILYGSVYNDPKESRKSFDNDEKCLKEANKLINKKLEGGYEEVLLDVKGARIDLVYKVQEAQKDQVEELNIDLQKSAGLMKEIAKITSLKKLVISYASEIPAEIGRLKNLEVFEIDSSYELKEIPEEIGELTKLRRLMIRNTAISQLPSRIGELKKLKALHIWSSTQLREIPASFAGLTALEKFWVIHNRNSWDTQTLPGLVLPDGLFNNMTELEEICLGHNELEKLPAGMEALKKCTSLKAEDNQLTEFPLMLTEMEALETLELESNFIETIPAEIIRLTSLSRFSISEQEVKNVPQHLLAKGIIGIRKHFMPEPATATTRKSVEPAPANRMEIIKNYEERFRQLERDAKNKMYDNGHLAGLEKLLQFFKGETDKQPDPITNDDEYYLRTICQVFSDFREWTFVEKRILSYMTGDQWSVKKDDDGFHEPFYAWIGKQLQQKDYPGFYGQAMNLLTEFGIPEKLSLQHTLQEVCYKIHNETTKIYPATSLDDFISGNTGQHLDKMMAIAKEYGYARTYLTQLLLQKEEDKLAKYIPQLTELYESEGRKHLRYSVLEKFCAHNPDKYESLLLDQLQKTDCMGCKSEVARILKKNYGEKYHELARKICTDTLEFISKTLNKKNDYYFNWSEYTSYGDGSKMFVDFVARTFGEEVRQDIYRYVKETKMLSLENIETALKYYGQDAMEIAAEGLKMTISDKEIAGFFRKYFKLIDAYDFSAYYEKVWEIACSEYREVAQTACLALSRQPVAAIQPTAENKLVSKDVNERYAGIMMLGLIGSKETIGLLNPLLAAEKNEELRDLAVSYIFRTPASVTIADAKQRIAGAEKRGKLSKPASKWIDESKLPELVWNDGTPLDLSAIRFLFYRQSRLKEVGPENELRDIYPLISREKSNAFAVAVLKLVIKNGGLKAPNRFALSVVALLGGDEVVPLLLKSAIDDKNENACAALGWQGSMQAAFALEKIMIHYKTKYPNVKNAAEEAFQLIADQQQLTVSELKDKMIPDFGFVNRELFFHCGKEQLVLRIDRNLKILISDQQGKKLAGLPGAATAAEKKSFKETGDGIKKAAKQLAVNLENYLCVQRKWPLADWKAFFLQHPIANALAQHFVWAVFDKREMKETFLLKADGIFEGVDGGTVSPREQSVIGLVHPILLSAAEKTHWQQVLAKEKIDPPFSQLNRETYHMPEKLQGKTFSFGYEMAKQDAATFKYRAEKRGWQRGSVIDSGAVSAFRKRYPDEQLEVFIMTENLGVQSYTDGGEVSFGRLFFVKLGSVVIGSYTYDEPRHESDPRLIPFQDVPLVVYSETINDLGIILTKDE